MGGQVSVLPRKRDWAEMLAGAIDKYGAGKQQKKAMDLEEALNEARIAYEKERTEKAKAMTELMQAISSKGQGDTGWELSRIGPGGPSFAPVTKRKPEEIINDIANVKKKIAEVPEGGREVQIYNTRLLALEKELKDSMNVEVTGEEGETRYGLDSILGKNWLSDLLAKDKPSTIKVTPRTGPVTTPRTSPYPLPQPSQPTPQMPPPTKPLLTGRNVPPEYQKLGVDRYREPASFKPEPARVPALSIGEEVDQLIKSGRAGIMGRGAGYGMAETVPKPGAAGISAPLVDYAKGQMPEKGTQIKPPPRPTEPEENRVYSQIFKVWYKLPTSLQYEVWNARANGLKWTEIAEADDIKKYINAGTK